MQSTTKNKFVYLNLRVYKTIKLCSIVLLWMSSCKLHGQNLTDTSSFFDKVELKTGYYGNLLWDNGISLGTEYLWKEKVKLKELRKGQKRITRKFLFQGSMGYSTNFSNKTDNGFHTFYGLVWRRTNHKGKQLNIELSPLGYYRSFLPETYEVKGDDVKRVRFPGRSYYAPSVAVGVGKFREGKTRSGRYLNLRCTLRTPYNGGTLPTLALEYGYRFSLKKNKQ